MKKKAWRWIILIVVLMGASMYLAPESPKIYPSTYEIENFPLMAQPDQITCGPTSLAMVLEWYGKPHSLDVVKAQTKTEFFEFKGTKVGGTTPEYMEVAANYFGVKSDTKQLSIEDLKYCVSQDRPPMTLVRSSQKTWHWVVVIGYNETHIVTADPGGGYREEIPTEIFKRAWEFSSDLYGNDVSVDCSTCGGDGVLWEWAGPLGLCEVCGGTGKLPDLFWILVELGEAKGYTAVVPNASPEKDNADDNLQNLGSELPKEQIAGSN